MPPMKMGARKRRTTWMEFTPCPVSAGASTLVTFFATPEILSKVLMIALCTSREMFGLKEVLTVTSIIGRAPRA